MSLNTYNNEENLAENSKLQINWRKETKNSAYTAAEWGHHILIGGSEWNRRDESLTAPSPYNKKGALVIIDKEGNEKHLTLTTRVQCIMPISNEKALVGSINGQTTILTKKEEKVESDIVYTHTHGIYDAIKHPIFNHILCSTGDGNIVFIDPKTMQIRAKIPASGPSCRLKTIKLDSQGSILYAGDYDGYMHKFTSHDHSVNLKNVQGSTPNKSPTEKPQGSSIAGFEFLTDGNIAVATRWKQLFVLSPSLSVLKIIEAPDNLSSITKINENNLLIGTRSGIIYSINLNQNNPTFEIVIEEPPVKQKENTVTSLKNTGNSILATFADGITYSFKP
jgi:hypothetical protein